MIVGAAGKGTDMATAAEELVARAEPLAVARTDGFRGLVVDDLAAPLAVYKAMATVLRAAAANTSELERRVAKDGLFRIVRKGVHAPVALIVAVIVIVKVVGALDEGQTRLRCRRRNALKEHCCE